MMKLAKTIDEAIEIAKANIRIPDGADESSVVSRYHHTLGRQMRNDWGLWGGGALRNEMIALGLTHPDDMSSLVLKCAYRDLKGQNRDIKGIVLYYQKYWSQFGGANLQDPSAKPREPSA
jgi:hypothetical protein